MVMLISGIVISFGYTALEFTNGQLNTYSKKQESISEYLSLIQFIRKESLTCNSIHSQGADIVFKHERSNTLLSFGESTNIQKNNNFISIKCQSKLESISFRTESNLPLNNIVDTFEIELSINGMKNHVSFTKTYDVCTLLNLNYERN